MGKKKEKKPDGELITDEFFNLKAFVGETLKFINDVAYNHDSVSCPVQFTDMTILMTENALDWFNTIMQDIADKFEGLEFEAIVTDKETQEGLRQKLTESLEE